MITWGISANSHDAALAVFCDEKLVFASHSERFSGKKNDKDLCPELINYACNNFYGMPDRVVWYENPFKKTVRQLIAGQGWKWLENDIPIYLARYGIIDTPVTYVNHHHSHAAAGYFTSPFDNACVLVIDAIGEFETLTIWKATGNKLKKLYSKRFPDSIGLFYSAMTQRVGLKPLEDEYVLMGMAAYGNASLHDTVSDDFIKDYSAFTFKKNLHRGCIDWAPQLIVNDSFEIASATQHVYEQLFDRVLHKAKELTGSSNLVLMGGCALNCTANRITGKYFENTWIMPNPGDAGSAIGAVLATKPAWRIDPGYFTPFMGYDMGSKVTNSEIVDYLIDHKICGVARGQAEFGPRALGNRSLLADPRGGDIKEAVNEIKQRQQFRPFAPAILEENVHQYFDMPSGWDNSRYMQVTAHCRVPDLFPAIIHRDNTSRVQTVPDDGSPFRKLLEEWNAKTGCPMLLNTSLNVKGQPMVNDKQDAANFERTYKIRVFN